MTATQWIIASAAVLGVGVWLMLPRGHDRGRRLGLLLVVLGLGILGARLPAVGGWLENGVFRALAAVTVISAVGTITFRNPVYCAISFGLTLLGTAGLFLFQGAQFLGLATVVVYAGAILVTFLFVLMLANPKGHALYDRLSFEPWMAAVGFFFLIAMLTYTLSNVFNPPRHEVSVAETAEQPLQPALPEGASAAELAEELLADEHVARLGAQLYGRYLIVVEIAGVLLLVALIGAVAIVSHDGPQHEAEGGADHE